MKVYGPTYVILFKEMVLVPPVIEVRKSCEMKVWWICPPSMKVILEIIILHESY